MNVRIISPSLSSTNPENMVKIGPVISEITWLQSRPLKHKVAQAKHIPAWQTCNMQDGRNESLNVRTFAQSSESRSSFLSWIK